MKIEYRKQIDSDTAPWLSLTNVDELQWNGVYSLRVSNDDGSHNLPFSLRDGETVTLVVKDHSHPGKLQGNRTIVQEITHVDRATGSISNYSRFCSKVNGKPTWSNWTGRDKNVITWSHASHIDKFTTAGIYNIAGERTNAGDGLPFANSNPGHTFHARLVVLDSSINGTEVCITQILMLSNRVGGDGNVYLRTGNAASKEELQSGNSWDLWGTLQQNIEVGQTTSLDDYIDNGVYSGVYMVSPTQLETFVLVVINNYAVAASMGEERNISQFKYALNIDGNFSYKTRTGRGEDEMDWGSWVDLGAATTTDIQDGAITAQKLSADVRKKVENPLRPLFIAAGAEYNDSGTDITKTAPWGETVTHKAGYYYLNGLGDISEEHMNIIFTSTFSTYVATNLMSAFRIQIGGEWKVRTNLRKKTVYPICYTDELGACCYTNSTIEVFVVSHHPTYLEKPMNLEYAFYKCRNLKSIVGNIIVDKINAQTFVQCDKLQEIKLKQLAKSITLNECPLISKVSILYIIENALPTSAITITLHPDVYARLADDADVVAVLEAQPLVSLVSV